MLEHEGNKANKNPLEARRENPRFTIPTEINGENYSLQAQEIVPEQASDTLIILTHGAAASGDPINMYNFWQNQLKDANFSTLVYHSRGVGKDMPSDGNYKEQTISDKTDDLLNLLFYIEKEEPREKYILSGMSMGGDVTVRAVQKLLAIAGDDSNEENRRAALKIIHKIKGFMFFAPAAYRDEIIDLPPGEKRTELLHNPLGPLWESSVFDSLDHLHMLLPIPVFVGVGENDDVVNDVMGAYQLRVYNPNDFVVVPGQVHKGFLSEESYNDSEASTRDMYDHAKEFAERITN